MLLSVIKSLHDSKASTLKQREDHNSNVMPTVSDIQACIAGTCKTVANSYGDFKDKAKKQVMKQKYLFVDSTSYFLYCSIYRPGFEY